MENKELFVYELGVLFAKHHVNTITKMEYKKEPCEHITITYLGNGTKDICVEMDSLSAMIVDIVKQGGMN